jgi:hypothetical protein
MTLPSPEYFYRAVSIQKNLKTPLITETVSKLLGVPFSWQLGRAAILQSKIATSPR